MAAENFAGYSLDDYVREFDKVFAGINGTRSVEAVWLRAAEHGSKIHENLREGDSEKILDSIGNLMCWLCALTTKVTKDYKIKKTLNEMILSKFPHACFYCMQGKCICSQLIDRGINDITVKKQARARSLRFVTKQFNSLRRSGGTYLSVDKLVDMYMGIYDHINFRTPIEVIVAHLQEEIGEVANCINEINDSQIFKKPKLTRREKQVHKKHLRELEDEIADVVTWTVALTAKLDYLLSAGAIYILRSIDPKKGKKLLKQRSVGIQLSEIVAGRLQEARQDKKAIAFNRFLSD
jgi:NTP pyrophosphatase (non-canonical NTP hydrolase)